MTDTATPVEPAWMSVKQTSSYTGLSVVTLHRYLAAGLLRSSRSGPRGWHRIRRDWADEFMETRDQMLRPEVPDGKRQIA